MTKIAVKHLLFLVVFSVLCFSRGFAQSITIGTVDPGPYSPGSTISIPFHIDNGATGYVEQNNTFSLFMSDASGNFSSTPVATLTNTFYATYFNYVIPAGTTPNSGYQFKITASAAAPAVGSPDVALTTAASTAITVSAGTVVTAGVISSQIGASPEVFGSCNSTGPSSYTFFNSSQGATTVTASFFNEVTQAHVTTQTISPIPYTFSAGSANYTVTIKAVNAGGIVSTKSYQLINNKANTSLPSSGNNTACLSGGIAILSFGVDDTSPAGIQFNYPGDTYTYTWGDGSAATTYTLAQLIAAGSIVSHSYSRASCGNVANGQNNTFEVDLQAKNSFCGNVGTLATSYAKIVISPTNFTAPPPTGTACTNVPVTFVNGSIPGPDPNASSATCAENPNALYAWLVDGVVQATAYHRNQDFVYAFPTHGVHTITLTALNGNGACMAPDFSTTICIQDTPTPSFTIPAGPLCLSTATITPVNTSTVDAICDPNNTYAWTISPNTYNLLGGSTLTSATPPQIQFTSAGTYTIGLTITTNSCGPVSATPQTLVVDAPPTAALSNNFSLCGTNQTLTFNGTNGSQTKTTFSNSISAPTYTWTVTGGAFSFTGGTNASSKFPKINFTDFATYTVTVTQTNGCGTSSPPATQLITFEQAPTVVAGSPQTICQGSVVHLAGTITGTYVTSQWISPTNAGSAFVDATQLSTDYTPTAADIANGSVTLTLKANTGLVGACAVVTNTVTITIVPTDHVTSAASKTMCSGSSTNYTITATDASSTYNWTAAVTTGAATGFTAAGNTNTINDVIINSNIANAAVVTYTITPTASVGGCAGTPFTYTVTIPAAPTITPTVANALICSNQQAGISLASNVSNTTYTWTVSMPAGVTGGHNVVTQTSSTSITDVLVNNNNTNATVTYTVTPYNSTGCAGTPVPVSVDVAPLPITSNAGPDVQLCGLSSYPLQGNSPGSGTGKWTVITGTGITFTDDTSPTSDITGLVIGSSYKLQWTITTAPGCQSSSTVNISVIAGTVAGTTAAVGASTVCAGGNSIQIGLTGQTGSVLRWESSVDNGVTWQTIGIAATAISFTNITQTTQYRAVVQNGGCNILSSNATTITVNQPPPAANAGANQTLCSTATTTLTGNDPGAGFTGVWSQTAGPGVTITNPNNFQTTVNGLSGGNNYTFVWTILAPATCTNTQAQVSVTVNAATVAGTTAATAPTTVCAGSNSGQITLTGNTGNILRWESSIDNGTTWNTISQTANTIGYSNITQTIQYRAVVQNGNCAVETSTITTITVNQPPIVANAGPDQNLCNTTSTTLQGNNPGSFAGTWSQTSGPAANITDPTNFQTTVTGLTGGSTYTFKWTILAGVSCTNTQSSVNINVASPTLGGTSAAIGVSTVCAGSNNGQISLTGQVGTILQWESSTDNGTTWQTIANNSATISFSNLTQTTQYRADVQSGACAIATSTVTTITVNVTPPPANAGTDQALCAVTTTTLTANNPGSYQGVWTQTSGPAVTIVSPNNFQTVVNGLTGGSVYTFKWTILASSPCVNTTAQVNVSVSAATQGGIAAANGASTVCAGSNSGTITVTNTVGNILRWEQSIDNGTTWQTIVSSSATISYSNLIQTTQYRAIVQNGACGIVPSTLATITVNVSPPAANAGNDQTLCGVTSANLLANNPGSYSGVWSQTAGPAVTIVNPNSYQTTINGLTDGNTYTFIWTILASSPCVNTQSQVSIFTTSATVGGATAAANNADNVCLGSNSGRINLTGQVGNVLKWQSSIDNGTTWVDIINSSNSIPFTNLTQTTQYRAVVQSGTCSILNSTATTITVNIPPPAANAGANQILCNAATTTLTANNPGTYAGVWTQTSGPGVTFTTPNNFQTGVTGMVGGNVYTFTWTILAISPCVNTQSQVTVTNNADVVASFTKAPASGCGNLNVQFTNTSNVQAGVTFVWDFGDGTSSNVTSPQHTFAQRTDGRDTVYHISLNVVANCVPRPPVIDSVLVRPAVPVARVLPVNTSGCGDFVLDVQNVSPGNNTSYDFYLYDGSTLVQKITKTDKSDAIFNSVSAAVRKTFTLYMVATGYCSNTAETIHIPITVSPPTVIAQMFVQNNLTQGCMPLKVTFLNNSFGGDTFHYTIYDDKNNVVEQPISGPASLPYTFTKAGTYFVTMVASNACGSNESPRTRIDVFPLPGPAFVADTTTGCKSAVVTFKNNTVSNDINTSVTSLNYDWDFGDGTPHSFAYQPRHVYHLRGTPFTVTLTVTNITTGCSTSTSRKDYINIIAPAGTEFIAQPDSVVNIPNYHFEFVDKTTGSPVAWKWDFGDGQTSTARNPQVTYADTGYYKVTLTTLNKTGCDSTITHAVRITGTPGQLYLPNAFIPSSATTELRTFAAKGSGIKTWQLQIFNVLGQLVWETTKLDGAGAPVESWDGMYKGTAAPQGVYVWQASATFINGTVWKGMSYNGSLPKQVGTVHLIR